MRFVAVLLGALVVVGCGGNGAGSSTSAEGSNCGGIYNQAEDAISSNQSCTTAADCTYTFTNCGLPAGCGTAVNQQGAQALQPILEQWAVNNCSPGGTCKPCPSGPSTVPCVNGVCTLPQP
jgi:hypothetical protein